MFIFFECPAFTMMFQNLARKFCFEKIFFLKLSNDVNQTFDNNLSKILELSYILNYALSIHFTRVLILARFKCLNL